MANRENRAGIGAFLARKASHEPDDDSKGRLCAPTIDESAHVSPIYPPSIKKGKTAQELRGMLLRRSHQPEDDRECEPNGSACEEKHHWVFDSAVEVVSAMRKSGLKASWKLTRKRVQVLLVPS